MTQLCLSDHQAKLRFLLCCISLKRKLKPARFVLFFHKGSYVAALSPGESTAAQCLVLPSTRGTARLLEQPLRHHTGSPTSGAAGAGAPLSLQLCPTLWEMAVAAPPGPRSRETRDRTQAVLYCRACP